MIHTYLIFMYTWITNFRKCLVSIPFNVLHFVFRSSLTRYATVDSLATRSIAPSLGKYWKCQHAAWKWQSLPQTSTLCVETPPVLRCVVTCHPRGFIRHRGPSVLAAQLKRPQRSQPEQFVQHRKHQRSQTWKRKSQTKTGRPELSLPYMFWCIPLRI